MDFEVLSSRLSIYVPLPAGEDFDRSSQNPPAISFVKHQKSALPLVSSLYIFRYAVCRYIIDQFHILRLKCHSYVLLQVNWIFKIISLRESNKKKNKNFLIQTYKIRKFQLDFLQACVLVIGFYSTQSTGGEMLWHELFIYYAHQLRIYTYKTLLIASVATWLFFFLYCIQVLYSLFVVYGS